MAGSEDAQGTGPSQTQVLSLQGRVEALLQDKKKLAEEVLRVRGEVLEKEREHAAYTQQLQAEVQDLRTRNTLLEEEAKDLRVGVTHDHLLKVREYENTLESERSASHKRETELRTSLEALQKQKGAFGDFERQKDKLYLKLGEAQKALEVAKESHRKEIGDLERAFLAMRERLEEDTRLHVLNSRSTLKKEAYHQLDQESVRTRKENLRLMQELRFHEETSDALQAQNKALRAKVKKLQLEVSTNKERDTAYATRGVRQRNLIKDLKHRIKHLERSLSQALRDSEVQRAADVEKASLALRGRNQEVDYLRRMLKVKIKEIKHIKGLAKTILDQRSEVEQFFLEALEHVKDGIRRKREKEYAEAKRAYREQLRDLATGRRPHPAVAASPKRKVDFRKEKVPLAYLSLEDREEVLRILLSKVNGTRRASKRDLPKHSFELPPQPTAAQIERIEAPEPTPSPSFFVTDMGQDEEEQYEEEDE